MAGAPKEMVGKFFGASDMFWSSCQSFWKELYGLWTNPVAMLDGHESIIHIKLESE